MGSVGQGGKQWEQLETAMYTFSGWFEHTVDEKGRVSIPSSFREKLSVNHDEKLFATRSLSGPCIEIFPASEWQRLLERVGTLSQSEPAVIHFRRRFISAAAEVSVDRSGRVLLPQGLRSQLGIGREVMIAGNIEKLEVWDRGAFVSLYENDEGASVLEGMSKLGF